ncbi:BglG family transcription antiterminator [Microbacterium indicum]|uniref:BglG family transcription antiterminator n=1 Tax=Microbacterium indicum TaxID=358100 RepID=UPI0006841888|nr:PTS sugar transporter subunit IIA [Microbacterium indicum]
MLAILMRRGSWVTAGFLADQLGVTPRSVRSYVTAINAQAASGDAIESGPQGYRATPAASGLTRDDLEPDRGTPRERLRGLVRMLLDAREGLSVYAAAEALHVSESTIEGDLRRVRGLLTRSDLRFERAGEVVRLEGSELARRRLVSTIVHDEMSDAGFDPGIMSRAAESMRIPAGAFDAMHEDLVEELRREGSVDELAIADVVLHIAIAAERVRRGYALEGEGEADPQVERVGAALDAVGRAHLGVVWGSGDRRHLAALALLAVDGSAGGSAGADPVVRAAVRTALSRASATYRVALDDPAFEERLAVHVQNLADRSREQVWSRNPMTRSLKSASPLLFEMSVAVSGVLSSALGLTIPDDEIANIAMHLGGAIAPARAASARLTATIVWPGAFEQPRARLREAIEASLGHDIDVVATVTGAAPDWGGIESDLVIATVEPPAGAPLDRVVQIPPFPTDRDIAAVADAAGRVRRQRRLAGLRAEFARWFAPGAFLVDVDPATPQDELIRRLAAPLVADGVIDEAYVESAIEREQLSSTAFTESLAVPHALTMSATRTAIALAVSEQAIPWGPERVQVVAFAAFSEADRASFQAVFEQFVDVFASPENARRLARKGRDLPSFLTELAALIDG